MHVNNDKNFQVEAPAKLLLLGEYLAMLGESALGISLEQKMTMHYYWRDTEFTLNSHISIPQEFYVYLKKLCLEFGIPYPVGMVEVTSDIPVGVGLGSSAAFSVCLAKVLLRNAKNSHKHAGDLNTSSPDELWRLSHRIETFYHKMASGIDTALASFGGTLLIEKSHIHNDNPSRFVVRPISLPLENKVYIGSKKRETHTHRIPNQVARIMKLLQDDDALIQEWLATHRAAIQCVLDFIKEERVEEDGAIFLRSFGKHITHIHNTISQLNMSTSDIDDVIHRHIEQDAFGGKITGACFGGSFYLLSEKSLSL